MGIVLAVTLGLCQNLTSAPKPAPPSRLEFRDGDRVVLIGNTLIERAQAYGHLETAILARLAPWKLTFRNLGWSGDTVFADSRGVFDPPAKGYARMLDHVGRLRPTVLLLGYGSNESFGGEAGLERFLAQYRKLIGDLRTRSATDVRVVLLTIPPQQRPGLRRLNTSRVSLSQGRSDLEVDRFASNDLEVPVRRNRQIAVYNAALTRMAREDRLALVDLDSPFQALWHKQQAQFTTAFTVDGRALNETGYRVLADGVINQWFPVSPLTVTIRKASGKAAVQVDGPLAVPGARFDGERLVIESRPGRFVLRVHGLPRGRYRMKVNSDDYGKLRESDFISGIAPSSGRPSTGVLALRQAVVAKNRLYFHRWRPQNTTYLFGFRKHEQGNNASEVAEFDKLVNAQESRIDVLRTRAVNLITIERIR